MPSWTRLRSAAVAGSLRRPELIGYLPVAATTAVAGALGRRVVLASAKSALVPILQAGAWWRANRDPLLYAATSAGWLGDIVLLPPSADRSVVDQRRELRCGAVAFGLQQVGYVAMMARSRVRPKGSRAVALVAWLAGLSLLDTLAGEGSAPDPIITTYGVLLGAMATMAWSAPSRAMQCGGVLFLASDSMILVRDVLLTGRLSRALAEAFVLGTYATAQALLIGELVKQPR